MLCAFLRDPAVEFRIYACTIHSLCIANECTMLHKGKYEIAIEFFS